MIDKHERQRGPGRAIVIAAAVTCFHRRGFFGTSVREIADEAGIAAPSIYHHFGSKQQLLREIMVQALREAYAMTRGAVLRAGNSPAEQLAAIVGAWISFHTKQQHQALIGLTELRALDPEGRGVVVALRDEQESLFRDVIERGVSEGIFLTDYPRDACRAIIAMGYSIANWYRPTGQLSTSELQDRYIDMSLAMVKLNRD